jgi:hypothetical protein
VIDLPFLSPGEAPSASPLEREHGVADVSQLGKLEVRGVGVGEIAVDAEVIRIAPRRALVVCEDERRDELARSLPGFVVDMTAAYAGFEIEGEELMRRLTDLDLNSLPAVAKVASVQALVTRDGDRFRLFVAREVAESVVAIVRREQEALR